MWNYAGPSSNHHCPDCPWQEASAAASTQTELFEEQLTSHAYDAQKDLGVTAVLTSPEDVSPRTYLRHVCAFDCAARILSGECPQFGEKPPVGPGDYPPLHSVK